MDQAGIQEESTKSEVKQEHQKRIENALASDVPHLYFNSFLNALGTSDMLLILERHGRPVAVLNTSYTVAKTLAHKLGQLIVDLEKKTGNTIMTTDDVAMALGVKSDPSKGNEK